MALLLLACPHAPLPVTEPPVVVPQPTELSKLLPWMLGEDPLARHLQPVDPSLLAGGTFEGQTIAPGTLPSSLQTAFTVELPGWEAEEGLRGTVGIPLLRGRRLAELEIAVGGPLQVESLRLLAPLQAPTLPPPANPRSLLDWLGNPGGEGLLVVAERNVLLGWLDSPGPEVSFLAPLLSDLRFDRLTSAPAGKLLLSRAQGTSSSTARETGLQHLESASQLALLEVAADTPEEQTSLRALREETSKSLGIPGDPANALLNQAIAQFALDASENEAVGLSLVAQAGLRWRNACPDEPCGGLDRPRMLESARRWGPQAGRYSSLWEVIFWKDAVDHLEVSLGRATALYAQDAILELLAPQMEPRNLLLPEVGPASVLALSRSLGDTGRTDPQELLKLLQLRLQKLATDAENQGLGDKEAMHRIAVRAAPKKE